MESVRQSKVAKLLQKEFIDGLKVNKNMKVDFFIITIFLKKEFKEKHFSKSSSLLNPYTY